jgi:hypothetical protein
MHKSHKVEYEHDHVVDILRKFWNLCGLLFILILLFAFLLRVQLFSLKATG